MGVPVRPLALALWLAAAALLASGCLLLEDRRDAGAAPDAPRRD
jgi:uncharacterized iron-regulated membrane protein